MNSSSAAYAAAAFRKRQPRWGYCVKHLHKQTRRQPDTSAWKNSWCPNAYRRVNSKKKIRLLALANSYSELTNTLFRPFLTSKMPWKYGSRNDFLEHNSWLWISLSSCAQWRSLVARSPLNFILKKAFTIVWGKEGLSAKNLLLCFAEQIFVSAALEALIMLFFSNPFLLSMPLHFGTTATERQIFMLFFPEIPTDYTQMQLGVQCSELQ